MKTKLSVLWVLLFFPLTRIIAQQSLWVGETYQCYLEDYANKSLSWLNINWTIDSGLYEDYDGSYVRTVSFEQYKSGTYNVKVTWTETDMNDPFAPFYHESHTWSFTCKDNPLVLNSDKLTLTKGGTGTIGYSHTYSNKYTNNAIVTFESNDMNVAKVSSTGEVTALSAGTATITVKSTIAKDPKVCTITVNDPDPGPDPIQPTGISLPESQSVFIGETITLTPTITPSNATTTLTWKSSDTSIATVSSYGVVKGIKEGTATITVTTANGKSDSCLVMVKPIEPISISIPKSRSVPVGETITLTPTITPSNATTTLTWSSNAEDVATVSSSGVVNGIKSGDATITVTTSNGKSDSCIITVIPKSPPIQFADAEVKALCVANWDTNGDGELSEWEAAAVTSLQGLFAYNTHITSFNELQYFSGLKCIDFADFRKCSSLTSVTIPNSVTIIRINAFWGCSGLTSITIPSSVKNIYDSAFAYCSGLTSVTIQNGVEYIGEEVFLRCSRLTSVIIPNSVKTIGKYAFQHCNSMTSVTIGSSVTSIGYSAFSMCISLTSVIVKTKTPPTIDSSTFSDRSNKCLYIPILCRAAYEAASYWNEFKEIVEYDDSNIIEFADTKVKALCVANWDTNNDGELSEAEAADITSIGNVFSQNKEITTFDELQHFTGLTQIGENAFNHCDVLTSITIPNSVMSIGDYAFSDCYILNSIKVDEGNACYDSRDECDAIIETATNILIAGCQNTVIPESITGIGVSAFTGCLNLTEITIPHNVGSIGKYAFAECDNLTSVTMERTVPAIIDQNTFTNRTNATLYVPFGSKAAYKSAEYWKEFKEIKEVPDDDGNLYMADMEIVTGRQMKLPIALMNKQQITGLQMDLYLPEGITVAKNSRGKLMIAVTDRMDGNYTVTSQVMEGGIVRINGYSPDGDYFMGNNGDILNVTIDIADNVIAADHTIQVKDIVLSDVNNTEYHPADAKATITVYGQGDVDISGAVNINDVFCIVNYILNRQTSTFLEMVADVDGNGSININDAVVLIDKFLLHRDIAPQQTAEGTDIADYLYLDNFGIMTGETKTIEIALQLSNPHEVRAVQGNIKLPEGFSFATKSNGRPDVKNLNDRSEDFTLSCELQSDGSMTFTHYSVDGYTYLENEGGIFTFKVVSDANVPIGEYDVLLTNIVLSIDGLAYEKPNSHSCIFVDDIDGINEVESSKLKVESSSGEWYDLSGRKIINGKSSNGKLSKGINIIRMSDGTTRKVLVK